MAREAIYWPGLMSDIENMIQSCVICQKYSRNNPRLPMQSPDLPDFPWQKIGIDFKYLNGNDFLVIVDYYSKYLLVNKISNKTCASVISTLKNMFTCFGLPIEIFYDNGQPFSSLEFKNFAKRYQIKLTTSSPLYPRSNGMVERYNQIVKNLFTKVIEENSTDPFLSILYYNNTPKNNLPSPAEIMFGRKTRTLLPVNRELLQAQSSYKNDRIKEIQRSNQNKQKMYYNRGTVNLSELKPDQSVLFKNSNNDWIHGKIIKKLFFNDYEIMVSVLEETGSL